MTPAAGAGHAAAFAGTTTVENVVLDPSPPGRSRQYSRFSTRWHRRSVIFMR